jgi:signal transduction histidine kinase
MRDPIHDPDLAARAMIAALADSSVTLAQLDGFLRYTAVYSSGVLLAGREVLGRGAEEIPGLQGASLNDLARRALVSGVAQVGVLALSDGDATRYLEVRLTPFSDALGEARLALLATDVTQSREAEGRLQLIESQLIERERFAAIGRLAATVAHEVNTPLQAIESCMHLAGRVSDEAERARYLRLAREEIQRVGYILRQMLDLYRPAAALAPLDINGLIERVLLLLEHSLARRSIRVERDLSSDLPVAIGRADEITQVLINLVFNAMHAMPQGGRLRITSAGVSDSDAPRWLVVRVYDSGVGIAPELHEQIFEPFFTTRADGSGLGLAISRRIVEGCGGRLRVESAPGAGSCFTIELPVVAG